MDECIHVLVVDDEEAFRLNMVKLLGTKGIDAVAVGSGEEALAELALNAYQAILLDVRLPGLTGLGTLQRIRDSGCQAAVIILTGHASLDEAQALLALGAKDYLLKPARIETVVQKIRNALGLPGE